MPLCMHGCIYLSGPIAFVSWETPTDTEGKIPCLRGGEGVCLNKPGCQFWLIHGLPEQPQIAL